MDEILYPEQKQYLESQRRGQEPLILAMEQYAAEHRIPILDWKSAEFLEQLVHIKRPRRVLEIGTAIAYSSIRIARSLRKKGSVTTIEKSADNIVLANEYIQESGYQDKIEIVKGDALEVMSDMKKKYDFIFLDADKEDYMELYRLSLGLLKRRGVLFVDNLLWHGFAASSSVPEKYMRSTEHVRRFNEMFLSDSSISASIYPIGDGIGIGIKL
ncbi:MAG: O-methyltransferase [Bacteroidota bacterium]